MPHLNGEEAVRELRRINPALRVLLMSGYNQQDVPSRLESPATTRFLQKPFNLAALEAALRALPRE